MRDLEVQVQDDHIKTMAATKRPVIGIIELLWNGLDADGQELEVSFEKNQLDALDVIHIQDNGTGIPHSDLDACFGNLGGSWKKSAKKTPGGRVLHGKLGKGRFRAFSLGSKIEWSTCYQENGSRLKYSISADYSHPKSFKIGDPVESTDSTGTSVRILGIHKDFRSLETDEALHAVTEHLALYLSEYPGISIRYNGLMVDPVSIQSQTATYSLEKYVNEDGKEYPLSLTVIEWTNSQERELHLCDAQGVSLHQVSPGIQAPGFNFTAYLKSDLIRDLDTEGRLVLDDLDPDLNAVMETAKEQMRSHFRSRAAEEAKNLIQEWKEKKIYPYEGEPADDVEEVEREVFDVVALNINSYLPKFDEEKDVSQRFTFNLVKQALRDNPESLQQIFENVLNLPKDRQDTFARLLKHTSLSNIISAAKIVTDRLNFIRGLETLVYDKETKVQLLERDQLHHILETETWVFGEHLNLTNSEEYLEDVLSKYIAKLKDREDPDDSEQGQESDEAEIVEAGEIIRDNGKRCRIDLILGRTVPQSRPDEFEHLVVELKRPSKKIDLEVITQIKSYAFAVARDERFHSTKTKWVFWAVSNEMTEDAKQEARQQGRPAGIVHISEDKSIEVWIKTWSEIFADCRSRLHFFRDKLKFEPTRDTARDYLRETHAAYLPKVVHAESEAQEAPDEEETSEVTNAPEEQS
jgi:hypothetical protein